MKHRSMTRREFLKLVGAGSATLAMSDGLGAAMAAAADRKPNILVIVADDLGYGELGCQGNKEIPTPNIDSIAAGGVRFTNGYVSCPVCSPTRAGLITGRYQQRFGHEFNPGPQAPAQFGLPLSETTLASRLKSGGYRTGIVGKWHLGNNEKYQPQDRGFDEFFGFLAGGHQYIMKSGEGQILRGREKVEEKEYLTDAFGREGKAFIERHKADPFFLYLTFNAVHAPLQATQKYLDRFSSISDQKRRTFAAMLSAMDDAVGEALTAVRKDGLENDTLIFFVSDNGGPTASTTSRNDPLRATKGTVYEGGIRVPFMVQWKGRLPAGKVQNRPIIALDIAPTAVAATGVKAGNAKFDGVDLLPFLTGASFGTPHEALYWRYGAQSAIRKGDWKLVKINETTELFDLTADVGEKTDLAAQKPDKVKELSDQLAKWDSELAEPLWGGRGTRPRARRQRANANG